MNKWRKTNFRKVPGIALSAMLVGVLLIALGGTVWFMLGWAVILAALAFHFACYRCPHCGGQLWRNHGEYCQSCGKRLDDPTEENK